MRTQIAAVLFLTAGVLHGSVITSGTITLDSPGVGFFDITLSDGVRFGGTVNYNSYKTAPPQYCDGCIFALPSSVNFNNVDSDINGSFSGALTFTGDLGTGSVIGPYDHRNLGQGYGPPILCTLPGNISTSPNSC